VVEAKHGLVNMGIVPLRCCCSYAGRSEFSTSLRSVANSGGAELALDTRNKDVAFAGHDTALIGSTTQTLKETLRLLQQTTTTFSL